jgi:hypothetical protein
MIEKLASWNDGFASGPAALGQTSAVADRLFHQDMGGHRPAASRTDTEIPAGIIE